MDPTAEVCTENPGHKGFFDVIFTYSSEHLPQHLAAKPVFKLLFINTFLVHLEKWSQASECHSSMTCMTLSIAGILWIPA